MAGPLTVGGHWEGAQRMGLWRVAPSHRDLDVGSAGMAAPLVDLWEPL